MNGTTVQTVFFLSLLGGALILLFLILKPFIGALFLAGVLTIVFEPMYRFMVRLTRGRERVAATLTVLAVVFILLVPVSSIGTMLFQEARALTEEIARTGNGVGFATDRMVLLEDRINDLLPGTAQVHLNPELYLGNIAEWVSDNIGSFFTGAARWTFNFVLMLFALFFFLKDGDRIRETAFRWSPLADTYDETIFARIGAAVNSVVKGALLIACVQGILAGIGYAVLGVPSPVLWGFVTALAALIPSVGTAIVTLPITVYLYATGGVAYALGMLVYGVFVVGMIDNFLRPVLIERGMKVHPFLILLSVFGGISYFGSIGFLAGPIILSLVFALIDVFPEIVHIHNPGSGTVRPPGSPAAARSSGASRPQPPSEGVVQLR